MRRIVIHRELIDKPQKKVMFQIKIPQNACAITGIMVEAGLKGTTGIVPYLAQCGVVTLSVPDKTEVFYSKNVKLEYGTLRPYPSIAQQGLEASNSWVHKGTKWDFESIYVPTNRTILEGFYQDEEPFTRGAIYEVKIYLQII